MKKFGQLFFAVTFFMLTSVSLMATNKTNPVPHYLDSPEVEAIAPNTFVGTWEYTVADVPYEYSKGLLIITKENKEYVVKVKLQYDTKQATEVSVNKNKMNFSVMVEGEKVMVALEVKDNSIAGKANSSQGQMSLAGKRSKS
ncbi:hypothetical protein KCTC52924_00388 [Arenibacter antarcticus]|nr:hypothetical protein [Arenibacter sp. H213]